MSILNSATVAQYIVTGKASSYAGVRLELRSGAGGRDLPRLIALAPLSSSLFIYL